MSVCVTCSVMPCCVPASLLFVSVCACQTFDPDDVCVIGSWSTTQWLIPYASLSVVSCCDSWFSLMCYSHRIIYNCMVIISVIKNSRINLGYLKFIVYGFDSALWRWVSSTYRLHKWQYLLNIWQKWESTFSTLQYTVCLHYMVKCMWQHDDVKLASLLAKFRFPQFYLWQY